MAEFITAYQAMLRREGGYQNHTVAGDRGGQTYAGIARQFHGDWVGWSFVDHKDFDNPALKQSVYRFYQQRFWNRVQGGAINHQRIAESLFDFAVNAGVRTAVTLAQVVVDTTPDGVVGPQTLSRLNQIDEDSFITQYALAKVARYAQIVRRDRSQLKFLLGWINRTLESVS